MCSGSLTFRHGYHLPTRPAPGAHAGLGQRRKRFYAVHHGRPRGHGIHDQRGRDRRTAWAALRGEQCLSRTQDWLDRQCVDSDRGVVDHDFPIDQQGAWRDRSADPAQQHRADDRVCRRVDRIRRGIHIAGLAAARLRASVDAGGVCGAGGRPAGRAADDSAARVADREGTSHAQVPRGYSLCRCADRRRGTRRAGENGVHGLRHRCAVQVLQFRREDVDRSAAVDVREGDAEREEGAFRRNAGRDQSGTGRCRLHCRTTRGGVSVRRRRAELLRADSSDQAVRRRFADADVSGDHSDLGNGCA